MFFFGFQLLMNPLLFLGKHVTWQITEFCHMQPRLHTPTFHTSTHIFQSTETMSRGHRPTEAAERDRMWLVEGESHS